MTRLLEGLRVLDVASFIAGPVATTVMADFGADVIKIEPPAGEPYRHRTSGPGVPESPYNYRYIVDNRTKRGLGRVVATSTASSEQSARYPSNKAARE